MMKINLPTFFALIVLTVAACAQKTETRNIGPFDQLEVRGSFDVVIEQGEAESIRIETTSIDPKEILTEIEDNALKIYTKKDNYRNIRTTVYVTYKSLKSIDRSGSGNLTCNSDIENDNLVIESNGSGNFTSKKSFIAKELKFNVSGSGNVEIHKMETRELELALEGSGNLKVENGTVHLAEITLSGSGNIEAFGLKTKKSEIRINGSGNVDISIDDSLTGKIAGSGNINYRGKLEKFDVKIAGSGEVSRD
jgi:hypothetical protein